MKNNNATQEALYYKTSNNEVKCHLCPHECLIKYNKSGICKTRKNIKGKLYTLSYGKPCAINIDPIEKKPLYHFFSGSKTLSIGTTGCNLKCLNCQNWSISQSAPEEQNYYELMPENIINQCIGNNCNIISYTYNEPIVYYEYMLHTSELAHKNNLKNVMVSAGQINTKPLKRLAPFIDAANIDLKTFDPTIFKELNKGFLKATLETLITLKRYNTWIEITNLVIPGWTDSMKTIKEMCKWLFENGFKDTPLHFSRAHPTYKLKDFSPTPVETIEEARNIALETGISYVYIGNIPFHEAENTYCHNCKELLIERNGFTNTHKSISEGKCTNCNTAIPGMW